MMNGLRTWVLHDLPHVLPSRSVQAQPASHVHTSTTKRRFWNIFDFGRKQNAAKKCPPPKNAIRASMEADALSIIPAARRNVLKAKSMTRVEVQKQVPKTKLFASPNMIVNVTSFTKKEDYTSLLDGNPVPMNMKLKLKGYRTLRTQKCEDFAFVPGGTTCELDIIPPRAFDGWKARENVEASKSVAKMDVAKAPAEKPDTNMSDPVPAGSSDMSKNCVSVDMPSHPPTFESISAASEEVKAAAQEQNPANAKPGTSELSSANNSTPEAVSKPKVECETNAEFSSCPKTNPEAELSTATKSERIEATSDKPEPTQDSQPQPAPKLAAKSLAETSENASVKKNVPENFLKMSKKPPKSPTGSKGGNSSLNRLSLETRALGDEKRKKFDSQLAKVAIAKELGIDGLHSLMSLKNVSAASVPYFAPIPRRKTSFAITHSQLIIHDDQPPPTKYSYSSAPSFASPAKSGIENTTFAPTKKMSKTPGKTKTAFFSSMGCSNNTMNKPFNAGGASNAGGFGNNGSRGQNLYPPPIPKRPTSTKQHNPERLQQAVRMKSTDSAGVLRKVENSGSSTLTGSLKESRMPSFKSWPDSGTQIQAQSYSCRRNRCRDNDNQRKCKRRERRKCCEEEEEEMIPPRTICTKVREEKKEKRPRSCKRQQRSCDRQQRSCERSQPKKKCKRYCCPALRKRPDCNFEKEKCPKEEKQMQTCGQRERKCGYGGVPRVPVKRTKPDETCMDDKCRQRRSCDNRREQSCGRRRRESRRECDRDDSCNRGRRCRTGGRGCNRRMSSVAGSQASLSAKNDYFETTNSKILNRTFADVRHGMSENLPSDQSAPRPQARTRDRVDLEHGKSVSSYSVRQKSGGCSVSHERFPSNVILNRTYSQLKSVNNMRPSSIVSLARPYSQLANDKNALLGRTRSLAKSVRDSQSATVRVGGKRSYGTEGSDDDNVKFFMKSREKPPPKCGKQESGSDRCAKWKKSESGSKCEKLKGKCGGDAGKGGGGKCEKLKGSCGKQTGSKCKGGQQSKSDSYCAGMSNKEKGQKETSEQRMKREREEIKECKKQSNKSKCGTGKRCGKSSKTKFEALGVDSVVGERLKKCIRSVNQLNIGISTTGRQEVKGLNFLDVGRSFSTSRPSCGKGFPIRADNRDYDVEELPILVEVEPSEVTEDPTQSKKKPVQRKKH